MDMVVLCIMYPEIHRIQKLCVSTLALSDFVYYCKVIQKENLVHILAFFCLRYFWGIEDKLDY